MIKDKIKTDLISAMKSGDTQKRDVLRMLDSMIKNEEIAKNKRKEGLSEEKILEVVGRAVKQRKDSISQYKNGGRNDLVKKEQEELDILAEYLPKQISEDDLRKIIQKILRKNNIKSSNEFGKAMGVVMVEVRGKADGDMVKKIVEEEIEANL